MKKDPAALSTPDYRRFIEDLKARVTAARISAARHVNRDMILRKLVARGEDSRLQYKSDVRNVDALAAEMGHLPTARAGAS